MSFCVNISEFFVLFKNTLFFIKLKSASVLEYDISKNTTTINNKKYNTPKTKNDLLIFNPLPETALIPERTNSIYLSLSPFNP